jgi:hypothetical protein
MFRPSPQVLSACATLLGLCLLTAPAQAGFVTYEFSGISNKGKGNKAADKAAGEAQLFLDVTNEGKNGFKTVAGPDQVDFIFRNVGTKAMSITDVYFDDGTLLDIANIAYSSGVKFSEGASPGNLPGGNWIDFNTSKGFLADSAPPVQINGVNPGEWLAIRFTMQRNQDFDDTIEAIALSLANPGRDVYGGLRIGIHVQGFSGGGSESFVNGGGVNPVPAPGGLILLATAVPFAFVVRRLRRKTAEAV